MTIPGPGKVLEFVNYLKSPGKVLKFEISLYITELLFV